MIARAQSQAGFSLVELMIAMFVLAIGVMATMAMQFSSLAGYRAARDLTGATEVARSIEQRLRTEALQWAPGSMPTDTTVYEGEAPLLNQLLVGTNSWVALHDTPITGQHGSKGSARFCPYVQGEQLNGQEFIRVSIAVVYPSANGHFPERSAQAPLGVCPNLGAILSTGATDALELEGLRATMISTSIRPLGQSIF